MAGGRAAMTVLLAQNLVYLPSHGGANRAGRVMLEQLAARGHRCVAVTPLSGAQAQNTVTELVGYLATVGATDVAVTADEVRYGYRGVQCRAVRDPSRLAAAVRETASQVAPTWALVPSDDPGLLVLGAALRATPGRVVYIAHTLQQLPAGPRAFYPNPAGTAMLHRTAGVVAVSRTAQRYLHAHTGIDAALIRPAVYGSPPFPHHHPPEGGAVTMVNPCGYKGIAILLGLADALAAERFLAVPTWGTTAGERAELARRANIRVVEPVDDIDEIFAQTAILLMPSLWDEAIGCTAVEAMLRGIPVLASDVAGLAEAKLGVPYQIPVRPIERYLDAGAGHARPVPVVPRQDLAPWLAALTRLRAEPAHHADLAARSRAAALRFVSSLDTGALEAYLRDLAPAAETTTADRISALPAHRRTALVRLRAARATG